MKKTKIICTIGPVSNNLKVMKQMALNGMNCVRINLSHANKESILETIEVVRKVRNETKLPMRLCMIQKDQNFDC